MPYPILPHFSIPLRVVDGALAVNEQDTLDDVFECAEAVLRYPLFYRIERPDFGIPDFALRRGGVDVGIIRSAVDIWEPRATANVSSQLDDVDSLIDRVLARISGRST